MGAAGTRTGPLLNVTQDEGVREEDEAYYDTSSTPQGGEDGRREVVAAREGTAPAATPAAAPPATAASVTGERPDGVGAAIQKEVDKGGPAWMRNQLAQQKKLYGGLVGPVPDKMAQEGFFQGVTREPFLRVWGYVEKGSSTLHTYCLFKVKEYIFFPFSLFAPSNWPG